MIDIGRIRQMRENVQSKLKLLRAVSEEEIHAFYAIEIHKEFERIEQARTIELKKVLAELDSPVGRIPATGFCFYTVDVVEKMKSALRVEVGSCKR